MNKEPNGNSMKRPERPTNKRSGHKRNPSIRTLMKTKRYQLATPKHAYMTDQIVFFPQNDDKKNEANDDDNYNNNDSKVEPQIQRLNSS